MEDASNPKLIDVIGCDEIAADAGRAIEPAIRTAMSNGAAAILLAIATRNTTADARDPWIEFMPGNSLYMSSFISPPIL
jgi:hypothetical protein